ncbi:hypothetical protein LBMAG37_06880 [Anaerolineae bacterium]|nr:hypothetical protein LBMAG37_06880 [Anaerolineae bacterium]
MQLHWVRCRLPAIEVPNHIHTRGIGSPHRECHTGLRGTHAAVRPQYIVSPQIAGGGSRFKLGSAVWQ